jgi:hypothetical protein
MLTSEEELVETRLLKYAQQEATRWGAERFAAEFRRRDLEERWLEASRTNTTPYAASAAPTVDPVHAGPVDAEAQDHVVETAAAPSVSLMRPRFGRHPSVPRPPAERSEQMSRRARRRERQRAADDAMWMPAPAEIARMTPAARRLYGLDDS